jgi:hypothetical protein
LRARPHSRSHSTVRASCPRFDLGSP